MASGSGRLLTEADVVIVGGGMAGCSLACHLGRLGAAHVVLLERDQLTSGATWHAAGLCTQFSWDPEVGEILHRSLIEYRRLEAETPGGVGWRPVGSLRLASSPAELDEFDAVLERGRALGLAGALLGRAATRERWPLLDATGITGSAHIPDEGYVDPARAATAFAAAAAEAGVSIRTQAAVRALEPAPDGRWRVVTELGTLSARTVVVAAGQWSRGLAAATGVPLPVVGLRHQHGLTGPLPGLGSGDRELPVLRDPRASFYLRQDQAGLLCGAFEAEPVTVGEPEIAAAGPFQLRPSDPDGFAQGLAAACRRVPVLQDIGIRSVVSGVDGYTADGLPLVGEWPGVPGLVWCTGFSLFGIAFGAGVGALLAQQLVGGAPVAALAPLAAARFAAPALDEGQLRARARQTYAREYLPPWEHAAVAVGGGGAAG